MASDVGLVDLDTSVEALSIGSNHRDAETVQHHPGGLIAAKSERPLEAERAQALLLACHEPGGREPRAQRRPRALEDGAGGHRRLARAAAAAHPPSTAGDPPPARRAAGRTRKAIRPAQLLQERSARRLIGRPPPKRWPRPRILDSSPRASVSPTLQYQPTLLQRNGYPPRPKRKSRCAAALD